ncbi:MAG TPA: hypothetical protein VNL16_08460 [Chloroflexota bacterium]|nr:hypothetical protein [Chloroflexota bacterium]
MSFVVAGLLRALYRSVLEAPLPAEDAAYDVLGAPVSFEGYARGSLLASYCHLHFGSNPALAPTFVAAAAAWGRDTRG